MGELDRRVNRTIWARKNRGAYIDFVGVRLLPEENDRLTQIAKLLNIGRSDLVRALIHGIAQIPLSSEDFAKVSPLPKSDKIRYV